MPSCCSLPIFRIPVLSGCYHSKNIAKRAPSGVSSTGLSIADGQRFAVRSQTQGGCGKLFKAMGVALPPTIREL